LKVVVDPVGNGGCEELGHGNSVVVVDRKGAGVRGIHSCEQGAGDATVDPRRMVAVGSMFDVGEMIGDVCGAAEEYAWDSEEPIVEEGSTVPEGRVYMLAVGEVAEHTLESASGPGSPLGWHSAREQ
jgi:hypothetical protein